MRTLRKHRRALLRTKINGWEVHHGGLSPLLSAGRIVFFTVVTARRAPILANDTARACLRDAIRDCRHYLPFRIDALAMMPDHIHVIWTLPAGDSDYSKRWGVIKKHFTERWLAGGGEVQGVSGSKTRHRRRGVWQPRFWEHTLRDERDYREHFDYLHFNPVKHGLVDSVIEWRYSSFHFWVRQQVYAAHWGQSIAERERLQRIRVAGE